MKYLNKKNRELLENIIKAIKESKIDFKNKRDVVNLYNLINKELEKDFTSYELNQLINNYEKNTKIMKFLKKLSNKYNKILYAGLQDYNFNNDSEVKKLCKNFSHISCNYVKSKVLDIAISKSKDWNGYWEFIDSENGKIKGLKFIDQDILDRVLA